MYGSTLCKTEPVKNYIIAQLQKILQGAESPEEMNEQLVSWISEVEILEKSLIELTGIDSIKQLIDFENTHLVNLLLDPRVSPITFKKIVKNRLEGMHLGPCETHKRIKTLFGLLNTIIADRIYKDSKVELNPKFTEKLSATEKANHYHQLSNGHIAIMMFLLDEMENERNIQPYPLFPPSNSLSDKFFHAAYTPAEAFSNYISDFAYPTDTEEEWQLRETTLFPLLARLVEAYPPTLIHIEALRKAAVKKGATEIVITSFDRVLDYLRINVRSEKLVQLVSSLMSLEGFISQIRYNGAISGIVYAMLRTRINKKDIASHESLLGLLLHHVPCGDYVKLIKQWKEDDLERGEDQSVLDAYDHALLYLRNKEREGSS